MLKTYPDNVALHQTDHDEYGDDRVVSSIETRALIQEGYGWIHGSNEENITSSSTMMLEPTDWVIDNCHRIEGMLVSFDKYCNGKRHIWFRISDVNIIRDHLGCNEVKHLETVLSKVEMPRDYCYKIEDGEPFCPDKPLHFDQTTCPVKEEECDKPLHLDQICGNGCKDWCSCDLNEYPKDKILDAYGYPKEPDCPCDCKDMSFVSCGGKECRNG